MIKLIIWDLDGVIWPGTMGEGGSLEANPRIVEFIKTSEACGVIHGICSNAVNAKPKLQELGLWDLFVFPSLTDTPKAARIQGIIDSCQLRADDVVFIDDTVINTMEAKFYIPALTVYNHVDAVLSMTLPQGRSRTAQYKILERKQLDRSNTDFLEQSNINVAIARRAECLPYVERIVELVNRSNRLNYSRSRFASEDIAKEYLLNVRHECFAVFAWDRYGYYGLIGFVAMDIIFNIKLPPVAHFVFSCRIMNMGIEQAVTKFINKEFRIGYRSYVQPGGDWITITSYAHTEQFIREHERLPKPSGDQVKLMAHCTGTVLWSYSKYQHLIEYERWWEQDPFQSDLFYHGQKIDMPRRVVFAAYVEFVFGNKCWRHDGSNEYISKVIAHFCNYIRNTQRQCLLLLPEPSSYFDEDPRYQLMLDTWLSHVDGTIISAVLIPHDPNKIGSSDTYFPNGTSIDSIRTCSRQQMHWLAGEVDQWVQRT
jgi:FkbH-like protein